MIYRSPFHSRDSHYFMVGQPHSLCPYSTKTKTERLEAAKVLTQSGIPVLTWAEDALAFAFHIPTHLFDLQLLVPDDQLEMAARVIEDKLGYTRELKPPSTWVDFKPLYEKKEAPSCFPWSIALSHPPTVNLENNKGDILGADSPRGITLHPQSYFHIDVSGNANAVNYCSQFLSPPLPQEFSSVQFPTRSAFLDKVITTILDPPINFLHLRYYTRCKTFISYIIRYTLPHCADGIHPTTISELILSLSEENQPFIRDIIHRSGAKQWIEYVIERRSILEAMGYATIYILSFHFYIYFLYNSQKERKGSRKTPTNNFIHYKSIS